MFACCGVGGRKICDFVDYERGCWHTSSSSKVGYLVGEMYATFAGVSCVGVSCGAAVRLQSSRSDAVYESGGPTGAIAASRTNAPRTLRRGIRSLFVCFPYWWGDRWSQVASQTPEELTKGDMFLGPFDGTLFRAELPYDSSPAAAMWSMSLEGHPGLPRSLWS